ncbi:hypothetical protein [Bifidobacterium sp. SO1]|uniref:hypothetical protein n=1 Tax=Bifidobacterium sp. SO1 TaxID=2809029 RepID=UPI001BDD299D|nr:hypothetical protein [Bifidobacterium sp. SO1]MBT1162773.1 hypothetical protein [Bifidobacterium sp. SO1]
MVMDANNRSHKPAGTPEGGQYDRMGGGGTDTDLDPLLTAATQGLRAHAIHDRMSVKSAKETRGLLDEAARIEYGPEGAILYDANGELVFRETGLTPGLDPKTMKRDPRVRAAIRATFRADLSDMNAADRRRTIRMAARHAGAYERRIAIENSPNRRYLPAAMIAGSLRRRKDQRHAVDLLKAIHYEDAAASANIIRSGYPDTREAAFRFINYTKVQREPKDVIDRKTGVILRHQGDVKYGTWTDREGKEHEGMLPEPKGAAARSYLRMMFQPTDGVPTRGEADRMCHVFHRIDDPDVQAKAFWNLCYGNRNPADRWDDVNFEVNLIGRSKTDREGARLLTDWSNRKGGQGNAARIIAYRKALSRDAMIRFLAMEPGDNRRARTMHTKRKRNMHTGYMEDVKPARLTEMRSFIHSVYEITDKDIEEYRATLPTGEEQ